MGAFRSGPATPFSVGDPRVEALVEAPRGPLVVPRRATDPSVRLSIVVPTYNEANNVPELASVLARTLDGPLAGAYEILFVDDDSPDGTWRVALDAAAALPCVRVVRRVGERGLATAVIRGWQIARGDVLAVIDGDLQHPPDVAVALWDLVERGADLAVASRHVPGGGVSDWSLFRRIVSRGAQAVGLAMLPDVMGRVSDPMSGYFMIRRGAIAERALDPLGYKLLVEVLGRGDVGLIGEAGYVFRERALGGSKATLGVYVAYLRHLARLRSAHRP